MNLEFGSPINATSIITSGLTVTGNFTLSQVTTGEKVLSAVPSGVTTKYDICCMSMPPATIASADWSTGVASHTGITGQRAYDSCYKYDAIDTNTWVRRTLCQTVCNYYLGNIDDSSSGLTTTELNTLYSGASNGQRVWGTTRNIYEKKVDVWKKIPVSHAGSSIYYLNNITSSINDFKICNPSNQTIFTLAYDNGNMDISGAITTTGLTIGDFNPAQQVPNIITLSGATDFPSDSGNTVSTYMGALILIEATLGDTLNLTLNNTFSDKGTMIIKMKYDGNLRLVPDTGLVVEPPNGYSLELDGSLIFTGLNQVIGLVYDNTNSAWEII